MCNYENIFKCCILSPPKSPLLSELERLPWAIPGGSGAFPVSASQATSPSKSNFSPLRDLCLSLHSPLGATHGVSNHDPFEDLASPVMLLLTPSPSPFPLGQPRTGELSVLLSWFSLRSGRILGASAQLRQGGAEG